LDSGYRKSKKTLDFSTFNFKLTFWLYIASRKKERAEVNQECVAMIGLVLGTPPFGYRPDTKFFIKKSFNILATCCRNLAN
jgi:hypothetical protein